MNNLPRQKLCEIIKLYGKNTCNDYKRTRGLLNDFCGGSYPEINFLLTALEEQVCTELMASSKIASYEMLSARLVKQLYTNRGMAEEIARWAVDSWALALGIILNDSSFTSSHVPHNKPQLKVANVAINRAYTPIQQTIIVSPNGGQYSSISEAIRNSSPDALILVRPGVYHESLIIDKKIQIKADGPKEHVIVESIFASCVLVQTDSDVLVQGLTMYCYTARNGREAHAIDVLRGRLRLINCNVTSDTKACLHVWGSLAQAEIQNCRLYGANGSGIFIENNARGTIENSDIYGNSYPNISVMQYANLGANKCRIYGGRSHGILVARNARGTIEDCDIFDNALDGVKVKDGGVAAVHDCYIYANARQEGWVYQNGTRNVAFARPPQTSSVRQQTSIPPVYNETTSLNRSHIPVSVRPIPEVVQQSTSVNQPQKKPNLIDLLLRSIRLNKEK